MKRILTITLLIISLTGLSQSFTFYIPPHNIDTNYIAAQDSHAIIIDTNVTFNNKIFLFIGGTGSTTNQYVALMDYATTLGYVVINISYPNSVAANSLKSDSDSLAFTKYRQELCFGTPQSSYVTVDTFNSIHNRLIDLLNYLDTINNYYNWAQHLISSTQINWNSFAVGGHSQGSGHAAYLGKTYSLDRILMFSGPNDYSEYFSRPALWLSQPGSTSLNQYYSYLSLNDEAVPYWKQYANTGGLGLLTADDSTLVDPLSLPFNNSHCLYTTQTPGLVILNHNVPVKNSLKNKEVWQYMLTNNSTTEIKEIENIELKIYPNPASSILKVNSPLNYATYQIFDLSGKIVVSGTLNNEKTIDISVIKSGFYFLKFKDSCVKFLKL